MERNTELKRTQWNMERNRMEGREIRRLMRVHRVTIRELAQRMQIYQKRIRHVREHGLEGRELIRAWIQGILGEDPGPV